MVSFMCKSVVTFNCKSRTSKELKYVMFEEIDEDEVFGLYYDYEDEDSDTVDDDTRYYPSRKSRTDKLISKVSFVPDENVTGNFFVKYKAYVEGASYTGKIKITVKETDHIDLIEDNIYENETKSYNIEKIFEDKTNENLKSVIFKLPNEEIGELFFNYNKYNQSKVRVDYEYVQSKLSNITFKPLKAGLYEIIYLVTDYNDEIYTGKISITVNESRVFKTVKVEDDDFEVIFNFQEDILDKVTTKKFEKVIFELPDTIKGALYNDYDGNNEFRIRNIRYNISELDELTFMAKNHDTININYKVYDATRNEYTGKIIIDIY